MGHGFGEGGRGWGRVMGIRKGEGRDGEEEGGKGEIGKGWVTGENRDGWKVEN
jgi:hypothetical protein